MDNFPELDQKEAEESEERIPSQECLYRTGFKINSFILLLKNVTNT